MLVTGGTGFVGSHTVRALLGDGHEVWLLVRRPERIRPALAPLGIDEDPPHVAGEVTDAAAVRGALQGCDAVVHAANVYSFSPRRAGEMREVNTRGTELVLASAAELGLDPVVGVSSYFALLPLQDGAPLSGGSPVGTPAGPSGRSKAAAETIAHRLQADGAPVAITHPGAVFRPHDPHLGETARVALMVFGGRMPVARPGHMPIVDVRDVAAAHAALVTRRTAAGGHLLTAEAVPFDELIAIVRRATGRRLPAVPAPAGVLQRALGRRRRVPGPLEGPWSSPQRPRTDGGAALRALGVKPRPVAATLADTVRWRHEAGHISARRAGRLAAEAPRPAVPAG